MRCYGDLFLSDLGRLPDRLNPLPEQFHLVHVPSRKTTLRSSAIRPGPEQWTKGTMDFSILFILMLVGSRVGFCFEKLSEWHDDCNYPNG